MNVNANAILGRLNVISIDISSWSGGAHLKKEDIGVDIPDRAFSLGRKYLIAPERISPFTTIRRRARDRCEKVGTRFIGGFAVPDDAEIMSALVTDLEEMRLEFEAAKADLLSDFARIVDEWISEPEVAPYEQLIRASLPSVTSIERRIQFDYSIITVGVPETAPEGQAEKQVAALGRSLFAEVADAASDKLKSFLKRNDGASSEEWTFDGSKTIPAIKSVRDKLKGLEFLDPRVPPVVDEIDRVLAGIPAKGKVEGAAMRSLYSILVILSDEERMLQLGEGLLSVGAVVEQEFGQLTPAPEQTTMEIVVEQEPAQEEPNQASEEEVWQQVGEFEDQDEPAHVPVMPILDMSGVVLDF